MLPCPKTFHSIHLRFSPPKSIFISTSPRSSVSVLRRFSAPPWSPRPVAVSSPSPRPPAPAAEQPAAAATAAAMAAVVEHVVLFKTRDGTDPAKLASMVSNLRSLASLDGVLHLTSAAILHHRSSAALGFTHLLHSRYATKDDLAAYSAHPAHVSVVREHVLPICEDVMAVDWVGGLGSGPVSPRPGSAARVTLVRLKEEAGEEGKREVLAALGEVGDSFPETIEQFNCGENFSPARAKGYSVGSITVFSSQEELEALEAKGGDLMKAQKEKVSPLVESIIGVDFVVPPSPPPAATSGL